MFISSRIRLPSKCVPYLTVLSPLQKMFIPLGQVGITLNINWAEPKTNSTEDIQAAENGNQFFVSIVRESDTRYDKTPTISWLRLLKLNSACNNAI